MSRATEIELAEAVMRWWDDQVKNKLWGFSAPPAFVLIAAKILGIEETDL